MLDVQLSSVVAKFLKKCDKELAVRLIDEMQKLSSEPFPSDAKRIVNTKEKVFRVRVGDYRIQYSVYHTTQILFISDIDKRSRAYD